MTDSQEQLLNDADARSTDEVDEIIDALAHGASDEYRAMARRYARRAELHHPVNAAPRSLAAGAVYAAGLMVNEKQTQPVVSEASGVNTKTIRRTYQLILKHEEGIEQRNRNTRNTGGQSFFGWLKEVLRA